MQDNTNVQSTVAPPSSNNSGLKRLVIVLALLGVIVLIVIVGVGAYLLGKSQCEKADSITPGDSDIEFLENNNVDEDSSEDEDETEEALIFSYPY